MGWSKISKCMHIQYRMFEEESQDSATVRLAINGFKITQLPISTRRNGFKSMSVVFVYLSKLSLWTEVHIKTQCIVINGCFLCPSFKFSSECHCLIVMPAVKNTGTVLSGTATTSTCHLSCTVPIYPAGSMPSLQTCPFLNYLFKTRYTANYCNGFPGDAEKASLHTPLSSALVGAKHWLLKYAVYSFSDLE